MNINEIDNEYHYFPFCFPFYFSVKSIGSPTVTLNTGITNAAATDSCNKLADSPVLLILGETL